VSRLNSRDHIGVSPGPVLTPIKVGKQDKNRHQLRSVAIPKRRQGENQFACCFIVAHAAPTGGGGQLKIDGGLRRRRNANPGLVVYCGRKCAIQVGGGVHLAGIDKVGTFYQLLQKIRPQSN
jgi:hypothetical protein